jgi:hypothetical protein
MFNDSYYLLYREVLGRRWCCEIGEGVTVGSFADFALGAWPRPNCELRLTNPQDFLLPGEARHRYLRRYLEAVGGACARSRTESFVTCFCCDDLGEDIGRGFCPSSVVV